MAAYVAATMAGIHVHDILGVRVYAFMQLKTQIDILQRPIHCLRYPLIFLIYIQKTFDYFEMLTLLQIFFFPGR